MKKLLNRINFAEEMLMAFLLVVMCIAILLSTFFRFTGILVVPWLEELSRYSMIWMAMLGLGVGARNNLHFTVENVVKAMPPLTHKAFFALRTIIIVAFSGFMVYISGILASKIAAMGQESPALHLPMWFFYISIPIGMLLFLGYTLEYAINEFRRNKF